MSLEIICTEKSPAAIGPYSQGIKLGNLVFTSGQIPLVPSTGDLVEGGVEEQAHQVLQNLQAVLEASGANLSNVVKTTVFLKDLSNFATVNKIYGEYFKAPYPARSCVQVAKLPRDVEVEIEAIASI